MDKTSADYFKGRRDGIAARTVTDSELERIRSAAYEEGRKARADAWKATAPTATSKPPPVQAQTRVRFDAPAQEGDAESAYRAACAAKANAWRTK